MVTETLMSSDDAVFPHGRELSGETNGEARLFISVLESGQGRLVEVVGRREIAASRR